MSKKTFYVNAEWDAEADVWYVSDSNVPGLITEAESIPAMIEKLRVMIPELLQLNGVLVDENEVPFELVSRYHETLQQAAH